MFNLRSYQSPAIDSLYNFVRFDSGHGYCKAPGGSGKSVLIAKLAERLFDAGYRVVILARSEKLITQNFDKMASQYLEHIGVYCAGLGHSIHYRPITIGTIQSLANVTLPTSDKPLIALVDECDEIHPDPESNTQYWNFFRANGNPRIVGFTATDFRTASGRIQWGKKVFDIPLKPLVDSGYLVPPVTKIGATPDLSGVSIYMGEYNTEQLSTVYDDPELLRISVEKILEYGKNRNRGLIFTQSVRHADAVAAALEWAKESVCVVTGDTDKATLNGVIFPMFEAGEYKYLLNCQLLTVGVDLPFVDFIVLLMATKSKRKFEQILYRGTRPYPQKKDFLALDMGNNFMEHGALGSPYREKAKREKEQPKGKVCPQCETWIEQVAARECLDCGFVFTIAEPPKVKHEYEPYGQDATIYGGDIIRYAVEEMYFHQRKSKNKDDMIVVEYQCEGAPYGKISEYLLPHHAKNLPRAKVLQFFKRHDAELNCPTTGELDFFTIDDLLWHCKNRVKKPSHITVDHSKEFPEIISKDFTQPPANEHLQDEIPW